MCKGPEGPSADGQINKMGTIHTREYWSALKKEILTPAMTWMKLKNTDTMLSEISESQKDKYLRFLLIRGTENSQIHGDRKNGGFWEMGSGRREWGASV